MAFPGHDFPSVDYSVLISLAHAAFYKLYPIIVTFPCHIIIYSLVFVSIFVLLPLVGCFLQLCFFLVMLVFQSTDSVFIIPPIPPKNTKNNKSKKHKKLFFPFDKL